MRDLTEREQWLIYGMAIGAWAMMLARIADYKFGRRQIVLLFRAEDRDRAQPNEKKSAARSVEEEGGPASSSQIHWDKI